MADPAIRVQVRADMPPGHVRTPAYLRGKTGVIERTLGAYPNPEELAYRHLGTLVTLHRVRFRMADIWGPDAPAPNDTVEAEIFAHWLTTAKD